MFDNPFSENWESKTNSVSESDLSFDKNSFDILQRDIDLAILAGFTIFGTKIALEFHGGWE